MARSCLFVILLLTLTGCSAISHLQELLTLKGYGREKDLQHQFVQQQRGDFDRMLAAARSGDTSSFSAAGDVEKAFGPPVFRRPGEHNGQAVTVWLYRYPKAFFNGPKIYLYYDNDGRLQDWQLKEPEAG